MNTEQQMVFDFHKKYNGHIEDIPNIGTSELRMLRSRLIGNEFSEFLTACNTKNLVEIADALGDLLYVVYGAAVSFGIDLAPVFAEIHRSNMTKLGTHDPGGKITKGPDFVPPDLATVLAMQMRH